MATECHPELFQNINVKTLDVQTTGLFAETKYHDNICFLKLHNGPIRGDNSTDIEDDFYSIIETTLKKETPHFLLATARGGCDYKFVIDMLSESQKYIFLKKWKLARGYYLYITAEERESQIYIKEIKKFKNKMFDFLEWVYLNSPRKAELYDINYFITPKLQNLVQFIKKGLPNGFDLQIAIQVAQALSICAKHQIMHNNLLPQNIYISEEPGSIISYKFFTPNKKLIEFTLETSFIAFIGNFEFGFFRQPNERLNLLCSKMGRCNKYTINLDWFTFLSSFVNLLEENGISTQLRTYIGGQYGGVIPCIIEQDKCHIDYETLDLMVTPLEFVITQKEAMSSISKKPIESKSNFTNSISNFFTSLFGNEKPNEESIVHEKPAVHEKPVINKPRKKSAFVDPSLF